MALDHPSDDARVAARYFSSFVEDYHRAFDGTGRDPLHRLINRAFRRKTFEKRTAVVVDLLRRHGVEGKRVLDLGCGSGEVSLAAARMGAHVTGIDIVDGMVQLARKQAQAAGFADRVRFEAGDILQTELPESDVTMVVAVVEYYADPSVVIRKAAARTQELLIIVDTRGPLWRRLLRYALARLKRFRVHYHPPDLLSRIAASEGFTEYARVPGHSYTVLAFGRAGKHA
ncbi:MAG TPA: methyltransferase domain-containing protein [Vicinamibacterales bacterium]